MGVRNGPGDSGAGLGEAGGVARFAAAGPVPGVVERLRLIVKEGIDRLYFSFPAPDADPEDAALSRQLLTTEVMAALR